MDPVVGAVRAVQEFVALGRPAEVAVAEIARHGLDAVGGDMAGLTWRPDGRSCSTIGATDALVLEIDQVQYRADRGPCLHAVRTSRVQRIDDTVTGARWREFRAAAVDRGVRSSLSVPVVAARRPVGALNFYARRPAQFDDGVVEIASLFAAQAAVVAALEDATRVAAELRQAMESRSVIEQAKGIIMAAMGCDADRAFGVLREQSQTENRKLREVASDLVARHQLGVARDVE